MNYIGAEQVIQAREKHYYKSLEQELTEILRALADMGRERAMAPLLGMLNHKTQKGFPLAHAAKTILMEKKAWHCYF